MALSVALFFTVIFLVIGLSTYLFGCNDIVGGDCSRYSTEAFTINRIGGHLPRGNLTHTGKRHTCSLQLGQVFSSAHAMREYNERIYPVGSTHDIQYDRFTGECKTSSYVNNLATCGFTFFMLIVAVWVLYFIYMCNESGCCEDCSNWCTDLYKRCFNCITCASCREDCGECCTGCGICCSRHWSECWNACMIRLAGPNAVAQSNNGGMTIIANTQELPQYVAKTGHDDIKRT